MLNGGDMLKSYCIGEGLTPFLDQTLISGFRVTSSDPTDDRLIQLSQRKEKQTSMSNHEEDSNVIKSLVILSLWLFPVLW